jgi:hypothetical protein
LYPLPVPGSKGEGLATIVAAAAGAAARVGAVADDPLSSLATRTSYSNHKARLPGNEIKPDANYFIKMVAIGTISASIGYSQYTTGCILTA